MAFLWRRLHGQGGVLNLERESDAMNSHVLIFTESKGGVKMSNLVLRVESLIQ